MKATSIAFEQRYSDGSGVEFGIRLADNEIEFVHINEVSFPVEELDWLISALQRIKEELSPAAAIGQQEGE